MYPAARLSLARPALLLVTVSLAAMTGGAALAADEGGAGRVEGFSGPGAPTADDDFPYIIEPGHEAAIEGAVRPLAADQDVGTGWTLTGIAVARGAITYSLARPGAPDRTVGVAVYHAGDTTVPDTAVVRRDANIKIALDAKGVPAEEAAAGAAPVVDRLLANSASLADIWIRREGRPALTSPVPADLGEAGGAPPPQPVAGPPPAAAPAAGDEAGLFTADNILIAAAILVAVLLLVTFVPALIRRSRRKAGPGPAPEH